MSDLTGKCALVTGAAGGIGGAVVAALRARGVRVAVGPAQASAEASGPAELGRWPAAWLSGLGTPWNTLQLQGVARVSAQQLSFEWVQGRLRMQGAAELALDHVSSSLTTLDELGSYRLVVRAGDQGLHGMLLN